MTRVHLLEAMFERHHLVIFRYLWRSTGRRELAEDLTQEVFVRAMRAFDEYDPRDRDRAWLFQIARRLLMDQHRQDGRHGTIERLTEGTASELPRQELSMALGEALDRLAVLDRDVFLLRELGGLSYHEIAATCDLSPAAVRSRISRARASLRARLQSSSPHIV